MRAKKAVAKRDIGFILTNGYCLFSETLSDLGEVRLVGSVA